MNLLEVGLDKLLEAIVDALPKTRRTVELLIPYTAGDVAAKFRNDGVVLQEDFRENGVYLKVIADIYMIDRYSEYLI